MSIHVPLVCPQAHAITNSCIFEISFSSLKYPRRAYGIAAALPGPPNKVMWQMLTETAQSQKDLSMLGLCHERMGNAEHALDVRQVKYLHQVRRPCIHGKLPLCSANGMHAIWRPLNCGGAYFDSDLPMCRIWKISHKVSHSPCTAPGEGAG